MFERRPEIEFGGTKTTRLGQRRRGSEGVREARVLHESAPQRPGDCNSEAPGLGRRHTLVSFSRQDLMYPELVSKSLSSREWPLFSDPVDPPSSAPQVLRL